MTTRNFRQWLEFKFLEWQRNQGGRQTVLQFAKYLGVSQQTVSNWWNDEEVKPQGDNIIKLADKLGLEVYDVLGMPRPDPALYYIQKHWDDLPPELQSQLLAKAKGYAEDNDRKSSIKHRTKKAF